MPSRFVDTGQPVNWSHPLNRGLLHWWNPLSYNSGGRVLFDIANKNHATLNTQTWGSAVPLSNAFSIYNGTGTATAATFSSVSLSEYTLSWWGYCTNVAAYSTAFANSSSSTMIARAPSTTQLLFQLFNSMTSVTVTNNALALDKWQHYAVTYISGGSSYCYVDNEQVYITSVSGSGTFNTLAGRGTTSHSWRGNLANMRIHNRAISASEIRSWRLDDISANPNTLNWIKPRAWSFGSAVQGGGGGGLSVSGSMLAAINTTSSIYAGRVLKSSGNCDIALVTTSQGNLSKVSGISSNITCLLSPNAIRSIAATVSANNTVNLVLNSVRAISANSSQSVAVNAAVAGVYATGGTGQFSLIIQLQSGALRSRVGTCQHIVAINAQPSGSRDLQGEFPLYLPATLSATSAKILQGLLSSTVDLSISTTPARYRSGLLTGNLLVDADIGGILARAGGLIANIDILASLSTRRLLATSLAIPINITTATEAGRNLFSGVSLDTELTSLLTANRILAGGAEYLLEFLPSFIIISSVRGFVIYEFEVDITTTMAVAVNVMTGESFVVDVANVHEFTVNL